MSARTTISFLPLILILLFSRISSAGEMLGILSMKLDGSHVTKLVSDSQLHFASPDISPDGKRVVFDSWKPPRFVDSDQRIHTCNIDGTNLREIGKGALPKWSPSGKLIAFQNYTDGVVVMQADGSGKEVVVEYKWGNPVWLGNNNQLGILQVLRNLHILDLPTGELSPIFQPRQFVRHGYCSSPDGKQLCYARGNGTQTELVVASADGKSQRVVYKGEIVPGLNWHPTRNLIVAAFGSEDPSNGKGAKLHLIDLDTDKVERIPHQDTSKKYVNPDFSPDGTRIYFSRLTK